MTPAYDTTIERNAVRFPSNLFRLSFSEEPSVATYDHTVTLSDGPYTLETWADAVLRAATHAVDSSEAQEIIVRTNPKLLCGLGDFLAATQVVDTKLRLQQAPTVDLIARIDHSLLFARNTHQGESLYYSTTHNFNIQRR